MADTEPYENIQISTTDLIEMIHNSNTEESVDISNNSIKKLNGGTSEDNLACNIRSVKNFASSEGFLSNSLVNNDFSSSFTRKFPEISSIDSQVQENENIRWCAIEPSKNSLIDDDQSIIDDDDFTENSKISKETQITSSKSLSELSKAILEDAAESFESPDSPIKTNTLESNVVSNDYSTAINESTEPNLIEEEQSMMTKTVDSLIIKLDEDTKNVDLFAFEFSEKSYIENDDFINSRQVPGEIAISPEKLPHTIGVQTAVTNEYSKVTDKQKSNAAFTEKSFKTGIKVCCTILVISLIMIKNFNSDFYR